LSRASIRTCAQLANVQAAVLLLQHSEGKSTPLGGGGWRFSPARNRMAVRIAFHTVVQAAGRRLIAARSP
jgi:hypothetical protein